MLRQKVAYQYITSNVAFSRGMPDIEQWAADDLDIKFCTPIALNSIWIYNCFIGYQLSKLVNLLNPHRVCSQPVTISQTTVDGILGLSRITHRSPFTTSSELDAVGICQKSSYWQKSPMRISVATARACQSLSLRTLQTDALTDNGESRKQLSCQFHVIQRRSIRCWASRLLGRSSHFGSNVG